MPSILIEIEEDQEGGKHNSGVCFTWKITTHPDNVRLPRWMVDGIIEDLQIELDANGPLIEG